VYDRLSSPATFTGVYRRAWFTDGRINHYADTMWSNIPSAFEGNTNTGTNEIISDIKVYVAMTLVSCTGRCRRVISGVLLRVFEKMPTATPWWLLLSQIAEAESEVRQEHEVVPAALARRRAHVFIKSLARCCIVVI
jgi:hypothetical protein